MATVTNISVIQAALKAPKGQRNSFGNYNYRSCEDILEAVKPLLTEHGMVLTLSDEVKSVDNVPQMVITDEKTKPKTKTLTTGTVCYIEATATITLDGDVLASVKAQAGVDVNKAGMDVAQCFGASSSYARKYALNGLFCIDDTKDADATNQHGKDKEYVNPHEDSGKKNEAVKDGLKSELEKATTIKELDEAMKRAEAKFNTWPDTWINGMNALFIKREKELK
jgi:hypothetical protein